MRIDKNLVLQILRSIGASKFDGDGVNVPLHTTCFVCGDSRQHKSKKRLYILNKNDKWIMYCHNDTCKIKGISFVNFLKQYHPDKLPLLKKEILNNFKKIKTNTNKEIEYRIKEVKEGKNNSNSSLIEHFLEDNCVILNNEFIGPKFINTYKKKAIDYLKNRNIPDKSISSFYFCFNGKFTGRIIIPFYKDNKPYYFQARSLTNDLLPKYLTCDIIKETGLIYNEYNIDKDKPVYITEGPIDSIFLPNAIALCGIKLNKIVVDKLKAKFKDIIFVFDNDEAGKLANKKVLKFNVPIFIFPKEHSDCKDINDLILKFNINKIDNDFLVKNTYSKLKAKMILASKCNSF